MISEHAPYVKQFGKLMDAIVSEEGMRQHEVLSAFLDAGYRAIRSAFLKGEAWQENEDQYMRIVKRCRRPQTMGRLSEMLAVTVEALEARCADFIGPTFCEIASSSSLGQFFTPHELSRATAMMTLGDMDAIIGERGYFTAQEPAAGMGGMVLAVAEYMREKGYDPARHCHWDMIDVEFSAMAGCYIQTSLCAVSGIVHHGNTLSLQMWAHSPTPMAVLFPKRFDPSRPVAAADSPGLRPAVPHEERGQLAFDFSV